MSEQKVVSVKPEYADSAWINNEKYLQMYQQSVINPEGFWRDHKSAKINAIRIKTLIENCDMAVIRFGDKYKQWNAAFDAGFCAALGKPYVTLHGEDIVHPLKEVDAAAMGWATTPEQVVEVIRYTIQG